jgi:hypothetical protein
MPKITKSILIQTQDGGAIVEVKNIFLDSSQKKYSITGHIVGEFDDFNYSRFTKCELCETKQNCKDCLSGDGCWNHSYMQYISDPFDSDFCEECEFENIDETRMMLLARYNFKFEAIYELERLRNAIECGAKTFPFSNRLEKSDLISLALSNGVIKKEETRFQIGRRKDSKPRQYTMTTYEGSAEVKIKSYSFNVRPEKDERGLYNQLFFENDDYKLSFEIIL